jgi:hypothetical protein
MALLSSRLRLAETGGVTRSESHTPGDSLRKVPNNLAGNPQQWLSRARARLLGTFCNSLTLNSRLHAVVCSDTPIKGVQGLKGHPF